MFNFFSKNFMKFLLLFFTFYLSNNKLAILMMLSKCLKNAISKLVIHGQSKAFGRSVSNTRKD